MTTQPTHSLPTSSQRFITIDVLRGFALSGILLVHIIFWYTAGPLPPHVFSAIQDPASRTVDYISNHFLNGKFFAFFSFLFGVSFFLQMNSAEQKQGSFVKKYSWRLLLLLIIGSIHTLCWIGDILAVYALLGFLLLLMRKWDDRTILILGLVLASNILSKLIITLVHFLPGEKNEAEAMITANEYYTMIRAGGWLEMISFNVRMLDDKINFQLFSGRLFMTLGYFLLGMYAGRKRWFADYEKSKPVFVRIFKLSLALILFSLIISIAVPALDHALNTGMLKNKNLLFAFSFIYDIQAMGLVGFYITGLTLLLYKSSVQRKLYILAPVGRMALTSYLSQTVFGLLLFYNVGFGLFEKTSPAVNVLMAIIFFILQVIFSKWWFKHYNFGPVEWIWRSGTLLKWQELKKKSVR